jgi:hypothetical protein
LDLEINFIGTGVFGYRHLRWKIDEDSPLENLRISGSYARVKFAF